MYSSYLRSLTDYLLQCVNLRQNIHAILPRGSIEKAVTQERVVDADVKDMIPSLRLDDCTPTSISVSWCVPLQITQHYEAQGQTLRVTVETSIVAKDFYVNIHDSTLESRTKFEAVDAEVSYFDEFHYADKKLRQCRLFVII